MHPADIKAALQKKGYTQTRIASLATRRRGHVHKTAVCRVIAGDLKSLQIATLIARIIELPVSQLWPGKYPELAFAEKLTSKKSPAQLEAELRSMHTPSRRTSGSAQRKAVAV
jgi:lambda repressor-like predicted transcriptional regulator